MRLKFSIIILFAVLNNQLFSQIAAWDFFGQSSPVSVAATVFDINLNQNLDSITRGLTAGASSGTNSFRTTGFKNDGISITNTDYFQITLEANAGHSLSLSTIDAKFNGTASYYAAPGVTSQFAYSLDGTNFTLIGTPVQSTSLTLTQIDLTAISALQNVPAGVTVTIRYYANGQTTTGGWGFYSSVAGSNGLTIGGSINTSNPNNTDSYVQQPTTQINATTISSLDTNSTSALPVFKATVTDPASGDGLPTNITTITLKNYNPANGILWQNVIRDITLLNGTTPVNIQQTVITNNTITLNILNGDLVIADGASADLTFSIYLNKTGLIDGTTFQCYVSALNNNWVADVSGSGFLQNFTADVVSNIFTIDVTATKLQFVTVPQSVWANQNFIVSVKATDVSNNTDLSANNSISIQRQIGSGILSSTTGLSATLTNGAYTWSDLQFDTPEYFSVSIVDNNTLLNTITSNIINCINGGQILNESFTDGDFNNNPAWFGETGDFVVSPDYELSLFTTSTTTDTSTLVTPVFQQLDSTEWQMLADLKFSPSSSNYIKYYLISNNANIKDTLHGYYIKIGETGSTDTPELYYQSGNTSTLLCRGVNGIAATNPLIRLKVIRTSSGLWRMYADPNGGSSFDFQASVLDANFYSQGFYTGIYCNYSSSYASNKFYFDDFYCGPVQVDTISPSFVSLDVVDSVHLDINFSEGISLSTAQNVLNYIITNGVGNPVTATRDGADYKKIHLNFTTPFISGTTYTITISNLKDYSNNTMQLPVSQQFVWYKATPFDVLINEIMADPTPAVQLPEAEYLEIYNRSAFDISLTNWTLTIGNSTNVFPATILPSHGYLILCTASNQPLFSGYGNSVAAISSSTSLTNDGNSVILKDKDGQVMSFVNYDISWYRNSNKKNGGWSLEQIDPLNPCGEGANWVASTDAKGGTPGAVNSVSNSNADIINPELYRAALTLPDTLLLTFSESIFDKDTLDVTKFVVDHNIGNPTSAMFTDNTKKKIKLTFNSTFLRDTVYVVTVTGQLKDCAGNLVSTSNTAKFLIPDTIKEGSFVINEVLFNPYTGGTDYIELYNNSSKNYDLRDAFIFSENDTTKFTITDEGFYFFSGDYIVLSVNPDMIYPFYSCPNKKAFIKLNSMPSYNSTDGRVTIYNKSYQTVDDFTYNESMHFQLLNSFKGVSLERVYPNSPTQDADNWHSAAESAGFGTPGYINSQYANFNESGNEITISPEIFSPDNDGYNDLLNINYKLSETGYVANVTIFDSNGKLIRKLVSNEMLSTQGFFAWDGLNDYHHKATVGIYVIFIEMYNLNGKVKHYKKTCVLGTKL